MKYAKTKTGVSYPDAFFAIPGGNSYHTTDGRLVYTAYHDTVGFFEFADGAILALDFELLDGDFIFHPRQISPCRAVAVARYCESHGIKCLSVVTDDGKGLF